MLSKHAKICISIVTALFLFTFFIPQTSADITAPPETVTVVYGSEVDGLIAMWELSGSVSNLTVIARTEDPGKGTVIVVGGPAVNPLTKKFADMGYLNVSIIDSWLLPQVWWDVHFGLFEIKKIETENATYIVVWGTGVDGTAAGMHVLASTWRMTRLYDENLTLPDHIIGEWYDVRETDTHPWIEHFKGHDVGFGAGDLIRTNITKEVYEVNWRDIWSFIYNFDQNPIFNAVNYSVPSYETLLHFLAIDPTDEIPYDYPGWYCVDYAMQLAMRAKYYNITSIGVVLGDKDGVGHAWNIAIYRSGDTLSYVFIEPQSDRIFKSDPNYTVERIIMLGG